MRPFTYFSMVIYIIPLLFYGCIHDSSLVILTYSLPKRATQIWKVLFHWRNLEKGVPKILSFNISKEI